MWEVDESALDGLKLVMGLNHPVVVRITALREDTARYHGVRGRGKARHHLITLNGGLSQKQANEAIWEQVTQAQRAEGREPQNMSRVVSLTRDNRRREPPRGRLEATSDAVVEGLRRVDPRS